MPKYKYRCADCDNELTSFHSIKEKLYDCPVCGVSNSLVRLPGTFVSNTTHTKEEQVGSLVREKIEEFREDLKRHKESIIRGHNE